MKNLKKLIIILIMLISTGCTVKYEIEITDDLKINEKIEVLEKNEKFEKIGTNNKTYIDMMYDVYSTNRLYKSYDLEEIIGNNESGIKTKKSYKSFEEYINNNDIRKTLFRFININEENGIITYSATHFRYDEIFNDLESNFPYDEIKVVIKLPFEVTETNADEVNKKTGEYTWIINKNKTTPEIKISFKNKISLEAKVKNFLKKSIIPISIGLIVILILFIGLFINHKRVNKI